MEWWEMALGIAVGGIGVIALQYALRFIITFVVICRMSPEEYRWWKLQNSIFDWDD